MKASFWYRLLAYIIDIIIVGLTVSVICTALPKKSSLSNMELNTLENQLIKGEITAEKYIEEYKVILYNNNKDSIIETTIGLLLTVGYFIVFQYMNKGQTIGKRLLKIRVVDNDTGKPPTITKGFIRTIIVFNIISSFVSSILINYLSKSTYISSYIIITEIEYLLVTISILFIIFRKDGRGIHDLISNTKVIEER